MGKILSVQRVRRFVRDAVAGSVHQKQELSLGNAVFGLIRADELSISSVGRAYAAGTNNFQKHGIKQVDRLMGNELIDIERVLGELASMLCARRSRITVSLDWTDYDSTDQSRIAVNLVTNHGRATPLVWNTVCKSTMKGRRTACEKKVLKLLRDSLPCDVQVTVVADRGFCSTELFEYIEKALRWNYVVRIRGNINVYEPNHPFGMRVHDMRLVRGAKPRLLREAQLTSRKYIVASLVLLHATKMKDAWYLCSNIRTDADTIVKHYGRRFTCEEQFRDEKNERLGMGSKHIKVSTTRRRNMLTLVQALATVLLTLVGAAGEHIGYDRKLRANTVKTRTHSLLRQGWEYVDGVQSTFRQRLLKAFESVLRKHSQITELYGIV